MQRQQGFIYTQCKHTNLYLNCTYKCFKQLKDYLINSILQPLLEMIGPNDQLLRSHFQMTIAYLSECSYWNVTVIDFLHQIWL